MHYLNNPIFWEETVIVCQYSYTNVFKPISIKFFTIHAHRKKRWGTNPQHTPRHIILFQSKPQTTFRVILTAKTLIVSGWIYFSVYLQFWLTVIGYIFHAKQEFHWVSANPLVIQYLNPAKTHWEAIASIINNFLKLIFLCQLKYVLKDPSGYFSQTIY